MDYKKIATANFFWIQTPTLYTTATYKCGNQLDCAKGTRVFFGFSAKQLDILPPHTKLGSVPMRYLEKPICERNLWWAHNSMDKIYLPITESFGPRSYDDCTLLFQKTKNFFMISICSAIDASNLRSRSQKQSLLYSMNQGRKFGFICDVD